MNHEENKVRRGNIALYQNCDIQTAQNRQMDRRTDRRTQLYIEAVLNGLANIGQREAALVLRELGVPIETAMRVLTRPRDRRRAPHHPATMTAAPATPDAHAQCPSSA
jgi:hypothetical protein